MGKENKCHACEIADRLQAENERLVAKVEELEKAARRLIHDWGVWQRNCEIEPGDTQEWVEENKRLKKEFEDSKTVLSYLANKGCYQKAKDAIANGTMKSDGRGSMYIVSMQEGKYEPEA